MPDFVRGGAAQHYMTEPDIRFRLEQARGEIHALTRQLIKLRAIIDRLVDAMPPETAAKIRLEMDSARS